LIAPAELPDEIEAAIRRLAPAAFSAVGGWGMARVDFLYEPKKRELFVNEINTLPGFTEISMYPRLWALSGLRLADLVDRLVSIAFQRHAELQRVDLGIRDFIAELAT
jgi:D-alanine-D-alanine ligase